MTIALMIFHVILSICIITLVLLQKGDGASAGASFGGGGAGSVFGASGSSNFLSKSTAILATIFFINSLALAYLAAHRDVTGKSIVDQLIAPAVTHVTRPTLPANLPAKNSAKTVGQTTAPDMTSDMPPPAAEQTDETKMTRGTRSAADSTDTTVPPPASDPSAKGTTTKSAPIKKK